MSIRLNASMPMFIMRQMNKAQSQASVNMLRLASGLRINSAADDAAGLAIATGMRSKIQGYNQSIRNANDGISMLQIAEGTLGEVSHVLQRIRELTVQAGNDTNSILNRTSIEQEIGMLSGSIKGMMQNSKFNGISLFGNNKKAFNIGIEGGSLALNIGGFNYRSLALNDTQSGHDFSGGRLSAINSNNGAVTINGVDLTAITGATTQKIGQLNAQLNPIGLVASGSNQVIGIAGSGITDGSLLINAQQVASSADMQQLVANINRDVAGLIADVDSNGQLILTNDTGQAIIIDNQGNQAATGLIDDTYQGIINFSSANGAPVVIDLNANGVQADLDALGLMTTAGDNLQSQTLSGNSISAADKLMLNGQYINIQGDISSAYDIAQAFNAASKEVTVSANTQLLLAPDFTQSPTAATDIRINGQAVDLTTSSSLDDTILKINAQLSSNGIVASASTDGKLSLVSKLGYDIVIEQDSGDFLQTGSGTSRFYGKLSFQSKGAAIQISSDLSGQANKESALAKIGLSDSGGLEQSMAGINTSTSQAVSQSLKTLDRALSQVANERSSYGAQQNRLGYSIEHLSGMAINTEASRSRIMDADFAAESAALAKNQLLMQASMSMLKRFTQMHSEKILSLLNSLG